MKSLFRLRLRDAPTPVKALAISYLLSLSLAYVYAIGNILFVVGWTPASISKHYYGAEKRVPEKTPAPPTSGEESLDLENLSDNPPVVAAQTFDRPSFKNLVATGHFHLFGMSSFFFGLCLLGLFTGVSEKIKTYLVTAPFVAVVLDNLSFLVTRFIGPEFSLLTILAGALMAVSFAALWYLIFQEVLKKSNEAL